MIGSFIRLRIARLMLNLSRWLLSSAEAIYEKEFLASASKVR